MALPHFTFHPRRFLPSIIGRCQVDDFLELEKSGIKPEVPWELLRIQRSEVEWTIGRYTTTPLRRTSTRSWPRCSARVGVLQLGGRARSRRSFHSTPRRGGGAASNYLCTIHLADNRGRWSAILSFLGLELQKCHHLKSLGIVVTRSAEDRCPEMLWSLKRYVCSLANKIGYPRLCVGSCSWVVCQKDK